MLWTMLIEKILLTLMSYTIEGSPFFPQETKEQQTKITNVIFLIILIFYISLSSF